MPRGERTLPRVLFLLFFGGIWTLPPVLRVVLAYGIVLLPAGHGVAPAGLLLLWGFQHFLLVAVLGWAGILALVATLVPPLARRARWLGLAGVVLLASSAACILPLSEEPIVTAASALPFAAFAARFLYLGSSAHRVAREADASQR